MGQLADLVAFVARSLTDQPEEVRVEESVQGKTLQVRLALPAAEMGKIIGKQGRIARALRIVLNAAASKSRTKANLIIEG